MLDHRKIDSSQSTLRLVTVESQLEPARVDRLSLIGGETGSEEGFSDVSRLRGR